MKCWYRDLFFVLGGIPMIQSGKLADFLHNTTIRIGIYLIKQNDSSFQSTLRFTFQVFLLQNNFVFSFNIILKPSVTMIVKSWKESIFGKKEKCKKLSYFLIFCCSL